MSAGDVWMPLYIGDYLSDTMHLTGAEHGAYLLLLMHSWRAPLPDDDKALAAIARTEPAAWRRMSSTIRAFFSVDGGTLIQGRLEAEKARAAANIQKRRKAGQASVIARKARNTCSTHVEDVLSVCSTGVEACVSTQRQHNARPLPSPIKEKTQATPVPPAGGDAGPIDARSALWREGVPRLIRMTGKPDRAARALLGRLLQSAGDDCPLVASVLHDAEAARPSQPEAWIAAAIQSRTGRRPPTRQSNLSWMVAELARPSTDSPDIIDVETLQ